jgi:hypothetical protein
MSTTDSTTGSCSSTSLRVAEGNINSNDHLPIKMILMIILLIKQSRYLNYPRRRMIHRYQQ